MMTNWQKLIEACGKFNRLHDKPEPGLYTWNNFVYLRYEEIKTLIQLIEDEGE